MVTEDKKNSVEIEKSYLKILTPVKNCVLVKLVQK